MIFYDLKTLPYDVRDNMVERRKISINTTPVGKCHIVVLSGTRGYILLFAFVTKSKTASFYN